MGFLMEKLPACLLADQNFMSCLVASHPYCHVLALTYCCGGTVGMALLSAVLDDGSHSSIR